MNRKIGDIVSYQFESFYRGTVKVKATIIDIYPDLFEHHTIHDSKSSFEMSIRFDDLGDTCCVHGMLLDDPAIS